MTMNPNRIHSHLDEIEWISRLADLKESQYNQSLLISAVVELLVERGVFTAAELAARAQLLETQDTPAEPEPQLESVRVLLDTPELPAAASNNG